MIGQRTQTQAQFHENKFPHQWYYDLAVRVRLKVVWVLEGFANNSVVVDLAIDCQGDGLVGVGKRLGSAINADNTQTFVSKDLKLVSSVQQAVS